MRVSCFFSYLRVCVMLLFSGEEISFENLLNFHLSLLEKLIPKAGPLQTFLSKREQILKDRETILKEVGLKPKKELRFD